MRMVLSQLLRRVMRMADHQAGRLLLLATGLLILGTILGFSLHHLLSEIGYQQIRTAFKSFTWQTCAWALLATAASYACLAGYDFSALGYLNLTQRVKKSTVALTSFIAFALGNTVGLGPLAGGAVRLRILTAIGLEPAAIGQLTAFNTLAFGLGLVTFSSLAVLWQAPVLAEIWHTNAVFLRSIASVLVIALLGFLVVATRQSTIHVWRWRFQLPPLRICLRQLLLTGFDLLFAAMTLWVLLPADIAMPWWTFFAFYLLALTAGVVSHIPGGVGVFETVMIFGLRDAVGLDILAAALVMYRVIYFLAPLIVAAALLAAHEVWRYRRAGALRAAPAATEASAQAAAAQASAGKSKSKTGAAQADTLGQALIAASARLVPVLLAALTFVCGLVLLISGVTPSAPHAVKVLEQTVPLFLVESAHMIASICGLVLLALAHGLLHRLNGAWWGALTAAILAAVLALPKGMALYELALLATLVLLLLTTRRQFKRKTSVFDMRLDPLWFLCLGVVVTALVWILFFSYRHVAYTSELWWHFAFNASAPRSLRALLVIAALSLMLALWHLVRRPTGKAEAITLEGLSKARAVVQTQASAAATLVNAGDKSLLFSQSGKSFVMYGKQGRSWVALFDPVGEKKEWQELIWRFIELAHEHGGRAAFYQVRPQELGLYLDAGLQARKLGEFAWVDVAAFNLQGGKKANLRTAVNRAVRDGLSFEVIDGQAIDALLPELQAISNDWLQLLHTKEKGFSLGRFTPEYVKSGPVAVVRRDGVPVAFATLMQTQEGEQASIDLMRYNSQAPAGTMEYLFVQLILHYQAQNYRWFGLGMAPFSGMSAHELASNWHRLASLLFGHGEQFYHFKGLRSFKEKFDPVWEPRYLIASGTGSALLALMDTAALISRMGEHLPRIFRRKKKAHAEAAAVPTPSQASTHNAENTAISAADNQPST